MTPENTSYFTKDFDLENMTEKMENCGSSVQNLAMSIAFTEKHPKTKASVLFPLMDSQTYKQKLSKSISSENLELNRFVTTFKIENVSSVKLKLAKLETILDKYQEPIDHIFRDEKPNPNKPFYKVNYTFYFLLTTKK